MKLGMNMLLWSSDVSGSEYDETFAMLKDAGSKASRSRSSTGEVDKYAKLGKRLGNLGLERPAVAARGPDESPISDDPVVRAKAAAATRANLDSAAALGAPPICCSTDLRDGNHALMSLESTTRAVPIKTITTKKYSGITTQANQWGTVQVTITLRTTTITKKKVTRSTRIWAVATPTTPPARSSSCRSLSLSCARSFCRCKMPPVFR